MSDSSEEAIEKLIKAYKSLQRENRRYAAQLSERLEAKDQQVALVDAYKQKEQLLHQQLDRVSNLPGRDIEERITNLVDIYHRKVSPDVGEAIQALQTYFDTPAQKKKYTGESILVKIRDLFKEHKELEEEKRDITARVSSPSYTFPYSTITYQQKVMWFIDQYDQKVKKEQEEVKKENEILKREERIRKMLADKGFSTAGQDLESSIGNLADGLNSFFHNTWNKAMDKLSKYLGTTRFPGQTPEEKVEKFLEEHQHLRSGLNETIGQVLEDYLRLHPELSEAAGQRPHPPSPPPPRKAVPGTASPILSEDWTAVDIKPPPVPKTSQERVVEIRERETKATEQMDKQDQNLEKYYQLLGIDTSLIPKDQK